MISRLYVNIFMQNILSNNRDETSNLVFKSILLSKLPLHQYLVMNLMNTMSRNDVEEILNDLKLMDTPTTDYSSDVFR